MADSQNVNGAREKPDTQEASNKLEFTTSQDYAQLARLNTYIDKTGLLKEILTVVEFQDKAFYRYPRRWGKSHFLSMIYYFFDLRQKEGFNELFGDKIIAQNQEALAYANTCIVIKFDLKNIYTEGEIDWSTLWLQLLKTIPQDMLEAIGVNTQKMLELKNMAKNFSKTERLGQILFELVDEFSDKYKFLILIDEYDSPLNKVLNYSVDKATMLSKGEEIIMNMKEKFFAYLKDISAGVIVTGVNKLAQASFFSDFNNLDEINDRIHLGFVQEELRNIYKFDDQEIATLSDWCGGNFIRKHGQEEFNPWFVTRYLKHNKELNYYWQDTGSYDFIQYLITERIGIDTLKELQTRLERSTFKDIKVSLKALYDNNNIFRFLYWAGYLSYNYIEDHYIIPNRDVMEMYDKIFFQKNNGHEVFYEFKIAFNKALQDLSNSIVEGYRDYISKIVKYSYLYTDKKDVTEAAIKSNVFVISKFVNSHVLQTREEVQFEGRTDFSLTYKGQKTVIEFKVAREKDLPKAEEEGLEQLNKYQGDQKILVLINKDTWDVTARQPTET